MTDNETNDQDTLTDLYFERVENFLKEQIFYNYWYGEPILDFVNSDGEFEDDLDDSDYFPESDYDSETESYFQGITKKIKTVIEE
jgi:hypothetical protein